MRRTCPRDRTPLEEKDLEGVKVDVCPQCSGAFFDGKELGKVTGDKELSSYLSRAHGGANSPMVCPACGNLMDLDKVGEVELDHCTSCLGVWLDAGEMDRILERGEGALEKGFTEKERAAESRHYAAAPRGGGTGRFAALGHAFRLAAWKFRRKR